MANVSLPVVLRSYLAPKRIFAGTVGVYRIRVIRLLVKSHLPDGSVVLVNA
jgi:hypothetical protein